MLHILAIALKKYTHDCICTVQQDCLSEKGQIWLLEQVFFILLKEGKITKGAFKKLFYKLLRTVIKSSYEKGV